MRKFALAMILAVFSHLALASEAKTEAKVPADDGPVIAKSKCPTCEADGVRADTHYLGTDEVATPEQIVSRNRRAEKPGPKIATIHCPTCKGSGYVIALPNGQNLAGANKKELALYDIRMTICRLRAWLIDNEKAVLSARKELAEAEAAESAALKEAEDAKSAKDF